MKHSCSLILIAGALAMTPSLYAQDAGCSKYARLSVGYGFPALGTIDTYDYTYDKPSETSTTTLKNVSLGKGIFVEGAFGCMFNKNIGLDLGLSYQMGSANTLTYNTETRTEEVNVIGSAFRFTPAIVFSAPCEKLSPYVRVGLPIGFSSAKITSHENVLIGNENIVETESRESFRPSLGLNTALGVNFSLGSKLGLFAEFNMISQSAIQSRSELTKKTVNGRDVLADMQTDKKVTEYQKEFVETKDTNENHGLPTQAVAQRLPFSSAGFRIGIHINL